MMNLHLKTMRLALRPLEATDAEALWPFVSDPNLPRMMTWEAHTSLEQTRGFIAAMQQGREQGTNIAWAILHGGSLVGLCGLHGITRILGAWRVDRAELGYWMGPPHQNQGFVTEAAREVLRCAFEELGLHKVTVGCVSENDASRRVIEKLGFRLVQVRCDGPAGRHLHLTALPARGSAGRARAGGPGLARLVGGAPLHLQAPLGKRCGRTGRQVMQPRPASWPAAATTPAAAGAR
jgi:ribosomal-protein-alanine N-acetyltransferase